MTKLMSAASVPQYILARRWPERLWVVRHGQSAGNVARDEADQQGHALIEIAMRDMDVPLSDLGRRQSLAMAGWFCDLAERQRPTLVMCSPYLRARQTAQLLREKGGIHSEAPTSVDERLREKEFGILDRLTRVGITERFPEQVEARMRTGKFYHRPPGGESWCDVILRLRSVLDTISLHYSAPGSRVLIVAHQVIVLCLRYLFEDLSEEQILAIDREGDVANCGITEYRLQAHDLSPGSNSGRLALVRYNFVAPLKKEGTPVTAAPDRVASQ
jgi:probable phosphoglycerate mutase